MSSRLSVIDNNECRVVRITTVSGNPVSKKSKKSSSNDTLIRFTHSGKNKLF